jgi:hypothetical protein
VIYKDIEDAIIARLSSLTASGIDIDVMPETESGLKKPFEKPRVTVWYKNSEYAIPQSTAETSQLETLHFEITIEARKLRDALGLYNLHQLVRAKLLGYRPAHGGRMYVVKSGFVDFKENLWIYSMEWATQTLAVMQADEDVEILITQINVNVTADN